MSCFQLPFEYQLLVWNKLKLMRRIILFLLSVMAMRGIRFMLVNRCNKVQVPSHVRPCVNHRLDLNKYQINYLLLNALQLLNCTMT